VTLQERESRRGTNRYVELGRDVAGLGGLVFAAAFVLGWWRREAYLRELEIPTELVTFDPLALALDVLPLALIAALGVFSFLVWTFDAEPTGRPRWMTPVLIIVSALSGGLAMLGLLSGRGLLLTAFFGGIAILALAGWFGSVYPAVRRRRLVGVQAGMIGAGVALLATSFGYSEAATVERSQGNVTLVTTSRIAGLPGFQTVACQWVHSAFTLVHVSAIEIVVRQPQSGNIWIIPRTRIVAMRVPPPPTSGSPAPSGSPMPSGSPRAEPSCPPTQ
jgi:nitrate reductase NapE component